MIEETPVEPTPTEDESYPSLHLPDNRWIGPGHGYQLVCAFCGEGYPCSTVKAG